MSVLAYDGLIWQGKTEASPEGGSGPREGLDDHLDRHGHRCYSRVCER